MGRSPSTPNDPETLGRKVLGLLRDAGGAMARIDLRHALRPYQSAPAFEGIMETLIERGQVTRADEETVVDGARGRMRFTRPTYRLTEWGSHDAPPPRAGAVVPASPLSSNPAVTSRAGVQPGAGTTARLADRGLAALIEALRAERERRGFSRSTIARASGLSEMAIQDLECGRTRNPHWETLARYAAALGKVVACELRDATGPGPDPQRLRRDRQS